MSTHSSLVGRDTESQKGPHSPTGLVMLEVFDVTVQIHHVKPCICLLSLIPQSVVPVALHYFLMNPQKPLPLLYRPAPAAERHMISSFPYISKPPSVLNGIALDDLTPWRQKCQRDTNMLGPRFKIFIVHVPGTGKDCKWAMGNGFTSDAWCFNFNFIFYLTSRRMTWDAASKWGRRFWVGV